MGSFGIFGPILFAVVGSLALTCNLPVLLIIYFSVITFGKVTGTIISFIIVCMGMTLIYFIAQLLGRPFVKKLFGNRLRRVEERLGEKSLTTVFYMRLVLFMNPPVTWILSTTNVSYSNLLLGTLLGAAPNIVLNVWLSGVIIDLIKTGESLNPIKTPKLLLPLSIGIIIFFTIKIIGRRWRGK